jgi:signal transduction histidine kinase
MLSIKDTGNGIATVDLPIIFDRFVQARNQVAGAVAVAALAWPFAKWLSRRTRALFRSDSKEGAGSEFTITMPLPET